MTCQLCPLHETSRANCIGARPALYDNGLTLRQWRKKSRRFTGRAEVRSAKYLLVGEALGHVEDTARVPFIGGSGQYLDKLLEILQRNGLDLSQVALSNAIRCHPPENRNPHMKEKRACRVHLDEEITRIKPKLIIALGAQAWSALQDSALASVARDRLKVLKYSPLGGEETDIDMAVTYHPAAVLRDKTRAKPLLEDLTAFLIHDHQDKRGSEDRPQVWVINNMKGLHGVIGTLEAATHVSIDIETVNYTPEVLTVALSFPPYKRAYVLPVAHPESALPGPVVMGMLREHLLEHEGLLVAGQHVKYDLGRMSWYHGEPITIRCFADDSEIFHYMTDEHAGNRSLDYLTRRYTRTGGYKEEIDKSNLANISLRKVAEYNGTDAAVVPGIIDQLIEELRGFGCYSQPLVEFYRRITPFVAALEANGMHIDLKALDRAKVIHDKGVTKAEKAMRKVCGSDLNLRSSQQLGKYLFENLGLAIPDLPRRGAYTKTGQVCTAAHVLDALRGDHPFVALLSQFRTATKMRSAYVEAIYKHIHPDQRVHPNFFIVRTAFGGKDLDSGGTVSGRFSAKRPAVQTIPKNDSVRAAYTSRYKGGSLMEIDGGQFELRCGGFLAGDDNVRDACLGDPHQWVANLAGTSRPIGKRIVFASIYQVTPDGLVERAGVDISTAKSVARRLSSSWSSLYSYLDRIGQEAVRFQQVCTPYGAYRRVPGADYNTGKGGHLVRSAINYIVQRMASDIMQLLSWRLMLELDGLAIPITSTHDSSLWDVPKGNEKVVCELMKQVIQEQWKPDILEILQLDLGDFPFAFDLTAGPNWLAQDDLASFQC